MPFALSSMQLTSSAFEPGGAIPARYTSEGDNVSPALKWTDAPEGTRCFVILCHDPDAPLVSPGGTYGFVHWVLYNIPASVNSLPEGVQEYATGPNNFDQQGYGGPMPPEGHGEHRYYFWVLALDCEPDLEAGLTMWDLLKRVEPNIIGMNRLIGIYERS